ncbi:MAG: hypothetical protein HQK77_07345 [Desulfobacterales bacterium]|nr:hypothetical protein [Desulfobacterales bacterium]
MKKRWLKIGFLSVFLLAYLWSNLWAESPSIIVLNTDVKVEKYQFHQDAFIQNISYTPTIINLADPQWNAEKLSHSLRGQSVKLVYAIGAKAYMAAIEYASELPIIFSSVINFFRLPMTQQTFGVSEELNIGMQLTIFRYIFPDIKRIGVLYSRQYTKEWYYEAVKQAQSMDLVIKGRLVSDSYQSLAAIRGLLNSVDVLWLIPDPAILNNQKHLFSLLNQCHIRQKAVFSFHEAFAKHGVTLITSVDEATVGRQAATMASRILAGKKISDKVQFPAGSQVILNLNNAQSYGLKYREGALKVVNHLVE